MSERLYQRLPAVYRKRDQLAGEPLRAFMAVLEAELEAVWSDTETTYDNWFIETCEEWLVSYLGEQVGVSDLRSVSGIDSSQRGYVANVLQLRQRKGTALALELVARDLTGYVTHVVEYFRKTAVAQHVQHIRLRRIDSATTGTVNLRDTRSLLLAESPFDPFPHTADVRRIDSGRGRYNLMNVGIHMWRTRRGELSRATATLEPGEVGRYRFEPFGHDLPLFAAAGPDEDERTDPHEVPEPLSRFALHQETVPGASVLHLDPTNPAFVVRTVTGGTVSAPYAIAICDLDDGSGGWAARRPTADDTAAVDPERGRLALTLARAASVDEVLVDFQHGYTAAIGAGGYDRRRTMDRQIGRRTFTFRRAVSRDALLAADPSVDATLEDAILAWNASVAALPVADRADHVGLIAVLGSRTYAAPATAIELLDGARLYLMAAPDPDVPPFGLPAEIPWPPQADPVRPVVAGDINVRGTGGATNAEGGGLLINGLLILGALRVQPGDLANVDVAHTTLAPEAAWAAASAGAGEIEVQGTPGSGNGALTVLLERAVAGRISSARPISVLNLRDSVVHGDPAIELAGGRVDVTSSTIIGDLDATELEASGSIVDGVATVERTQTGCVRFSFVRDGSATPRRFRCQPDLAVQDAVGTAAKDWARAVTVPSFASLTLGQSAYARLSVTTPTGIAEGAEDSNEMGAHHHLEHARRTSNLRRALREWLRFGLDAGLLFER